ncbi:hypothetical protein HN51_056809 [Arachis hypogaea]
MYLFRKIASDCSMYLFIVGEHVENYHCHYCWHNAVIKYLSLMERSEGFLGVVNRTSWAMVKTAAVTRWATLEAPKNLVSDSELSTRRHHRSDFWFPRQFSNEEDASKHVKFSRFSSATDG